MLTIPINKDYYTRDRYLVEADLDQKKFKSIKGYDGKDIELEIKVNLNQNLRESQPNFGVIRHASKDSQFKVGTTVICNHFAFQDKNRKSSSIGLDDKGVEMFDISNFELYFGVNNGHLVPREGVLLCEPIQGKATETSLELLSQYSGNRRDIAKVLKVWEGCEDFKEGDYVLLNKGGDYLFEFEGKHYLKCDTYFDDVIATVDSEDWRITEIKEHAIFGKLGK